MSEYYKYQGAESQIDWGTVGKEMSEVIIKEKVRREKIKDGLAESTREDLKTITEIPIGELTYMNNVVAEDSENASSLYKLKYDQMTRGLISPKDYTAWRQNALDSTKLLYGVAKKYQEVYGNKMQRYDGDKSQYYEVWQMEQVEGIAKLKNYKIVRNPNTGEGLWVKMEVADKDWAEISKDPNNIIPAQQAMIMVSQEWDKFDLQKYSSDATKSLGAVEKQIVRDAASAGGLSKMIKTVDATKGDYTLKGETVKTYKNWEDRQVSAIMSNPFNTTSILTDINMNTEDNKRYTFTYNKSEFDNDKTGRLVYMDRNNVSTGEPVFQTEQEDAVKETIRLYLRSTIDEKSIETAGSRRPYAQKVDPIKPTPPSFEDAYKMSIEDSLSKIKKEAKGDTLARQVQSAMKGVSGFGQNVRVAYDEEDDKIKVHDGDEKKAKKSFPSKNINEIKDYIYNHSISKVREKNGHYHTAASQNILIESQMGETSGSFGKYNKK